jgi:hypothetical protein
MDLLNILKDKAGTLILVNGRRYTIGTDGIARGIDIEDAQKLLQNHQAWKRVGVPEKVALPGVTEKPQSVVVSLPPPLAPKPISPLPKEPPVASPAASSVASPRASQTEVKFEEPPEENEEWPDPKESMDLEYLRQMAEAYEVKWAPRTGKKRLIQDILAAMYPDGR